METLLQDVRYAWAMMRRNKSFTAAGLLTLALGIGATTAVFSVVYGVLLRPLPYPESQRLVRLSEEHAGVVAPLPVPMLSNLTYHAWAERATTVEAFAAYRAQQLTIVLPEGPARVTGSAVTPSLFPVIGAAPALGRFFREDEGGPGADAVIVLSDRFWRESFKADPAVIGRGIVADGEQYSVVGIARSGFAFPDGDTRFWTPRAVRRPSPDDVAGGRGQVVVVNALARLRPGVATRAAEGEGTAAARRTVRPMAAMLLFGAGGPPVVHVRTMVDEMTSRVRAPLLVLLVAVVCVLLIACTNVANMCLARGVARQRELTVRAALGASRVRLTRQLLTESLVLSAAGGVLGVALARALVAVAPALASRTFPRIDSVTIDARALAVAAAVAIVAAVLSGLAPALRGARFNLAESLHGGDGATAGGFRNARAAWLRDSLLVAEAAFAVMLVVASVLMARSFVRLTHVDAGYTADHVLAAEVFVPGGDADSRESSLRAIVAIILDRARSLPGVVAAGAGNMMPLDNSTMLAGFPAPWTPLNRARARVRTIAYTVTPGYAEALGLRLRAGRLLDAGDTSAGHAPWLVNEEFARLYLPPKAVGYQFVWGASTTGDPERTNEIVGIVGNVLKNGNDTPAQPEMYRLARDDQRFYGRFEVAVRTGGAPAPLAPLLRAIVRETAPTAAVEIVPLSERVAASVAEPRFATTVLVAFAVLALTLASVGLYGALSYSVSQRRRELGVRAALGAAKADLVRLVLREGLTVTAKGLVIGLVAAAAATRLMQGLLFGVAPLDFVSFVAAPAALLPVAVIACLLPAYRAASTDPADALRCE